MASTGNKPINVNLDFSTGAKVKNLTAGVTGGEAVEYNQLNTALAAKQDVVTGGSGIDVTASSISIDLATSGTSYDQLFVTNTGYASLNGTYEKLPYSASVSESGTDLDMVVGDTDVDFNAYYKDNGNGIWALAVRRDDDGVFGDSSTHWRVALTTNNPAAISYAGAGSATFPSYIPDYLAVDNYFLSLTDDADGTGKYSPGSADSSVSYGAGNTPAGLIFSNSKLAVDFANTTGDAASTKVFPSSIIKTYVDEQITSAKDLSNHPFNNSVAALTGSPTNAQSAIEAAAAEINTLDGQVSTIQTINGVQDSYIADHTAALGISAGADSLSAFTGSAAAFAGASGNVQGSLQALGDSIGSVYGNIGTINGLAAFETDFGTGFVILPNNSNTKALFQATELELQNLSQGLGQFWAPIDAVEDSVNVSINNPGTDTFGGTQVAQGDVVLLAAQTAAPQNGLYVFDTSSTAMVRANVASLSAEFSPNKTVQILASGDTWAYTGSDDPVIGTDDLTFAKKTSSVIPDDSIVVEKFSNALTSAFNAKTDKYAETVSFVAGTPQNITHGLNSTDVIVQCRDTSGNVVELEIDITDSNYVTINSPYATADFRIVVIG